MGPARLTGDVVGLLSCPTVSLGGDLGQVPSVRALVPALTLGWSTPSFSGKDCFGGCRRTNPRSPEASKESIPDRPES